MEIFYSSAFARDYKRLPPAIKNKAKQKEKLFRHDPFDPRLKTHKLHGRYKDYWAFSIAPAYRTVFALRGGRADFIAVGSHDVYR